MKAVFDAIIAFEKEFNVFTVLLRIVIAVIFGGIIGFERGKHGRQAGMRTHILVCLGGTMSALIGVYGTCFLGFDGDPFRIAAQVVSGIGFLGAGMIIVKSDRLITGLTTAAIMWTTAIIGIGVGIGFYSGALIAVVACVFTAAMLTRIERKRRTSTRVYMEVDNLKNLEAITERTRSLLPPDAFVEVAAPKSGTAGHMGISVISTGLKDYKEFAAKLKELDGIHFIILE